MEPPETVPFAVPLVVARNLSKRYGAGAACVVALDAVSLAVSAGEFLAVMGRSGCGKTTLLNLLAAMDLPTSGNVSLAGHETATLDDDALTRLRRRLVGFVFQSFHLMPTLSVAENVELPLLLEAGGAALPPAAERTARVADLLQRVGLQARHESFPHQLSGGEMQRVALARALVHRPVLLVADEPTGNLDEASASGVLDLMQELGRESGAAVVMATHSAEAARRATRILRLRDGRIAEDLS